MMERTIFKYELADAFGDSLAKIEVIDSTVDNVRCIYPCVSHYVKGEMPQGKTITLDERQLKKIKSIILKNIDIFEIEKVEFPLVIDGYINRFYFSVSNFVREIEAFNISAYRKEESINAKRILQVFDEIVEIFVEVNIDKKYFNLELDS